MSTQSLSVLVTGAAAPGAPGVIKSLRLIVDRDVRIVAADSRALAAGYILADDYTQILSPDHLEFIPSLLSICRDKSIDIILPLRTAELLILSKHKEEFRSHGIRILISDHSIIEKANNKHSLFQYCHQKKIPIPRFKYILSCDELLYSLAEFNFPKNPICIKPPVANGSRGFRIIVEKLDPINFLNEKPSSVYMTLSSLCDVLNSISPFPELLLMEYLPGDEYSVDILADNGAIKIAVPRLREKISLGITTVGMTVFDKYVIDISSQLVNSLELHGIIGVQLRKDATGIPKILEINPRIQGTTILSTAAGANFMYAGIQLALGEQITIPKIEWGVRMIRHWDEVFFTAHGAGFTMKT